MLSDVVPEAVLFRGEVDSARSMLTSIAAAAITLTGLVFSVTMLVLQLTAAQYSPRAVGALLTDRNSKLTLGVFVGTFTYSLAILRTIAPDGVEFDRGISVAVAVVLALVTVAFFVQYVNHVAHQLRPTAIIGRVADTARDTIDAELPDEPQPGAPAPPTTEPARSVHASTQGVVQHVDVRRLAERAAQHDLRVHVVPRVGQFVPAGAVLLQIWGDVSHDGDDGRVRVVVPEASWQEALDLAVDEIAHYGKDSLQIRARLLSMLHDLATVAPPDRLPSIAEKVVSVEQRAEGPAPTS